jgi:hypothetical protein
MEQFHNAFAPDRCDNAELRKVNSDRINHGSLLSDQQMPCAVKHQATLLLRRLGWHEAHIGAADGFANSLCVSHVVLLPFDVGLHVSWRHQSHAMTEGLKFARPMVRRSASLDADQTGWQLLEERQDGATPQLAADDHPASSINARNLED